MLPLKKNPKPLAGILNFGNRIQASTEIAVSIAGLVIYINFLAGVMRHRVLTRGHSGRRKSCQSEVITCILSCPGGITKIWLHQPRLEPRAHHACRNLKAQMVPYVNGGGTATRQEQIQFVCQRILCFHLFLTS